MVVFHVFECPMNLLYNQFMNKKYKLLVFMLIVDGIYITFKDSMPQNQFTGFAVLLFNLIVIDSKLDFIKGLLSFLGQIIPYLIA